MVERDDPKEIQTRISLHTITCMRLAECRKKNNQHDYFHAMLKRRLRTTSFLSFHAKKQQSLLTQSLNLANPFAMLIGSRTKPSPANTLASNNSLVSRLKIGMGRGPLPKACWREATTSSTLTGLDQLASSSSNSCLTMLIIFFCSFITAMGINNIYC